MPLLAVARRQTWAGTPSTDIAITLARPAHGNKSTSRGHGGWQKACSAVRGIAAILRGRSRMGRGKGARVAGGAVALAHGEASALATRAGWLRLSPCGELGLGWAGVGGRRAELGWAEELLRGGNLGEGRGGVVVRARAPRAGMGRTGRPGPAVR